MSSRSSFFLNEVFFLGEKVTRTGIFEVEQQLKKAIEAQKPRTLKQIQKF